MDRRPEADQSPELAAWLQEHGAQIAAELKASGAEPGNAWGRLQDYMARKGVDDALLNEVRAHASIASAQPSAVVLRPSEEDAAIRGRVATLAGILPRPGTNTNVTKHGGAVMDVPRVFVIYMGNDWGGRQNGLNAAANTMTATLSALFRDGHYWAPLSEYGAGSPDFAGAAFHDYPQTAQFYDGDPSQFGTGFIAPPGGSIAALLTYIVESNPAVTAHPLSDETNLLYFLFLSSNHSVTLLDPKKLYQCGPGTVNSMCGFHGSANYHKDILGIPFGDPNLFYAVGCPGISTGGITHELVESFTDRVPGSGWISDADGSEIGDICNACADGVVLTEGGLSVASYWLKSQGRCLQQSDVTPIKPVVVTCNPEFPSFDQDIDLTVHAVGDQGQPVPGTVILQNPCQPNPITFRTDVATRVRLCRVQIAALPRHPNGFPPPPQYHFPVATVIPDTSAFGRGSLTIREDTRNGE